MDEDTQQNGPVMNGDDELAKTLNGGLKFEETPPAPRDDAPADDQQQQPSDDQQPAGDMGMGAPHQVPADDPALTSDASDDTPPTMGDLPKPQIADDEADSDEMDHDSPVPAIAAHSVSDLDSLNSSALDDLKPLVGKLNLSPEEKFDTLLLIIRSTDDQSMLAEAHAAAKEISDDTKRAQALLDIIKEVDYFNSKK
jgi:hypothetical protein